MSTRIPLAAKRLVEQVREHREDAQVQTLDVDGFGTARTIAFDEETSNWLADIIDVVAPLDNRIASHLRDEDGALHVTFVADPRGDDRRRFPIAAALKALAAEDDSVHRIEDDEQPSEYEVRKADLQAEKVADLRKSFPDYGDRKKADLIAAVLADEGLVP